MIDAIRNPKENSATIVYQFINNVPLKKIAMQMDFEELKRYLYQLLMALDASHSRGIIHRDVKLSNTIVNPKSRHLLLIDWGQADFYYPLKRLNCGVGTMYFKAPELHLNYSYYDYSVDMWSFGSVLAGQVFGKNPFFKINEKNSRKIKYINLISKYLGTDSLFQYLKKYNIKISDFNRAKIEKSEGIPWDSLKPRKNITNPSSAIDLISKILVFDHKERLTAKEAMQHPFFDSTRHEFDIQE